MAWKFISGTLHFLRCFLNIFVNALGSVKLSVPVSRNAELFLGFMALIFFIIKSGKGIVRLAEGVLGSVIIIFVFCQKCP